MSDAGLSPAVGIAGHGGMPMLPASVPVPVYERAASVGYEDVSPPPLLGMTVVDEVYAKVGAANDLIIVRKPDGTLTVSDFHVMFGRKERVKGGPPKSPSSLSTANKAVHTYINGKLQPQLYLRVKDDGFCTFADGKLQPAAEALAMLAEDGSLVEGVNSVRFEIRYLRDPRVLVAECFAFVWGVNQPLIVVDIDGTITRSDVSGLLMTLTPTLVADRTHAGICPLLARMVEEAGAQVVYLTSRPIVLAPKTRAFLMATEQDGKKLPLGPLRCCLEKVSGVLWRELVAKNMDGYKLEALLDLARPFRDAGRMVGEAVFAAGIGNRLHDAVAYKAAGIPSDFIFLIDPESNLRVWDGDTTKAGGSSDNTPISPQITKKREDQRRRPSKSQEQSRRKRISNRLFSPSRESGDSGRAEPAAAAAIEAAALEASFGDNDDDEDDNSGGDGGGEALVFTPALVEESTAAAAAGAGAVGAAHRPLSDQPPSQLLWSSSSETNARDSSSSADGVANKSGSEPESGNAGSNGGKGPASGSEEEEEGAAAAAGTVGEADPNEKDGGLEGGAKSNGRPPRDHLSSSSAAAAAAATPPAASIDYQSYGDARFFDRLRASLDLAAWEAQKAVGAAAHATQAGVQAGVEGVHAGVQAGVHGVQAGVHAAGNALAGKGFGEGEGDAGEEGEEAAARLADRVKKMSSRGDDGQGEGGRERKGEAQNNPGVSMAAPQEEGE
ncbi:unnamed protein product [Scytosiphon promiscuus]